ncbi:MAG: hypothetical protein NVSMB64_25580 [Candidatus Velthaea sp.]
MDWSATQRSKPISMIINRNVALSWLGAAVTLAAVPRSVGATSGLPLILRTMRVPFDHDRPEDGTFELQYALLRPFDSRKPTVAVVSDGQQFFITASAFRPTTEPLFDERFNVVGIFGRGQSSDVQRRIRLAIGGVNWTLAYRLLCARQWLGDIEAMRQALLGANGMLLLYGRSGGAMMVHQYLSRYGSHVARAFTQAAVDQYLEAKYGLESDRFWDEISPDDRLALTAVLRRDPLGRDTIITVLQRQNFFVDRAHLADQRHTLIKSLAAGKTDLLERLVTDYQVAAIRSLEDSPLGPAIAVRLFELEAPLAGRYDFTNDDRIFPDHEAAFIQAAPLFAAMRAGQIAAPTWDHRPLHNVGATVVMLAGRWDHTCDYRSQIALASCYPASTLVILDDDHAFHRLVESGKRRDVTLGALSPSDSAAYQDALSILDAMRWHE